MYNTTCTPTSFVVVFFFWFGRCLVRRTTSQLEKYVVACSVDFFIFSVFLVLFIPPSFTLLIWLSILVDSLSSRLTYWLYKSNEYTMNTIPFSWTVAITACSAPFSGSNGIIFFLFARRPSVGYSLIN
jgi:hypothetical protein